MKKIFLALILVTSNVKAEEPRLQTLMATMGGYAQMMLTGILYDNFQVIEEAVAWVNDHPEPTADLQKIKDELGLEAVRFKMYDKQAHNAANAMGEAARQRDMKAVSKHYGKMIKSCTKCHEAFRDRLRRVLH